MDAQTIAQLVAILSNMDRVPLNAIKEVVNTIKTSLGVVRQGKEIMSSSLDVAMAPLLAKKVLLTNAIEKAKTSLNVLPPDLVAQNRQMGMLNTIVNDTINTTFDYAEHILFDLNHLAAEKTLVLADLSKIDSITDFLDGILTAIDQVLATPI